MSNHDCNQIETIRQLNEKQKELGDDLKEINKNYGELTNAIVKLTSEIETNRYWHKMTVTILTITLTVIFGILQVCLRM